MPKNSLIRPWVLSARALVVGLVAGLLAIAYRLLAEYGGQWAVYMYGRIRDDYRLIAVWLLAALAVSLLAHVALKWAPDAGGSGIPQVRGFLAGSLTFVAAPVLFVRFAIGGLMAAMGLSLGREGPSIHIGAAGGKLVAETFHYGEQRTDYMVSAGGAAGLAAAFSAPISGLMFALEELHHSFSRNVLLSAMAGAFLSGGLATAVFGLRPLLSYVQLTPLPVGDYPLMILVGIVAGLVGVAMTKGLLFAQWLMKKIPLIAAVMIALLIALGVGLFLPDILGGGENLVREAELAKASVATLVVLCLGKALFTMTSFGCGVPGGIFMPILAVGALAGAAFGKGLASLGVIDENGVAVCAVAALAGGLAASVKSPLTAIMLTVEMTGSIVHMLPVALAAFIALGVSDALHSPDVYGALLRRRLGKSSRQPEPAEPPAPLN